MFPMKSIKQLTRKMKNASIVNNNSLNGNQNNNSSISQLPKPPLALKKNLVL